jgi:hypothetical protein
VTTRYWGKIGKEVADETAKVTILTLEDKQLQAKAFELANVIVSLRALAHRHLKTFTHSAQVNNVLTNPRVVDQAAIFLQIAVANLTAKPETQAVLLQITQSTLAHLIAQESTLALISDLLARAAIQVRIWSTIVHLQYFMFVAHFYLFVSLAGFRRSCC